MKNHTPLIIAALLVALLAGCDHKPVEQGVAESHTYWQSSSANPIPGIDEAFVTFVTLKAGPAEGVPFAVWSDLLNGASGGGGGSGGGASYEGNHSATDGRRVEFRAKTTDGKSGSITIAGVDYDLAKGSLFLVSTSGGPPKVAQVTVDLSGFSKSEAIKELAKSNLQIRGFFEKQKKEGAKTK
jgi:hypothetical protein